MLQSPLSEKKKVCLVLGNNNIHSISICREKKKILQNFNEKILDYITQGCYATWKIQGI